MNQCVARQQEKTAQEREEIERQRKILSKRKPPTAGAAESKRPKVNKEADGFVRPAEKV